MNVRSLQVCGHDWSSSYAPIPESPSQALSCQSLLLCRVLRFHRNLHVIDTPWLLCLYTLLTMDSARSDVSSGDVEVSNLMADRSLMSDMERLGLMVLPNADRQVIWKISFFLPSALRSAPFHLFQFEVQSPHWSVDLQARLRTWASEPPPRLNSSANFIFFGKIYECVIHNFC